MTLAVVMPVYNHSDDTRIALDTLAATTVCDVIVVDDGSTDDTAEMLRGRRVICLRNEANRGVNASWNVGIAEAMRRGYDHICVANNDLAFSPGWWRPLQRALDTGGYAVVSPYATMGALPADWPHGGARTTNPCSTVMHLLGSCFAFKPSLIEEVGFFPEVMRHYYGDNWLEESCLARGYRVGHIRESYVHHYGMHTTSEVPGSQIEHDRIAYEGLMLQCG